MRLLAAIEWVLVWCLIIMGSVVLGVFWAYCFPNRAGLERFITAAILPPPPSFDVPPLRCQGDPWHYGDDALIEAAIQRAQQIGLDFLVLDGSRFCYVADPAATINRHPGFRIVGGVLMATCLGRASQCTGR